MKKTRFTEEQLVKILRDADKPSVAEVVEILKEVAAEKW
jgi:hypothetical protein